MLVDSIDEMRRFLPAIMMKGSPEVFNDALEVAQAALVEDILGQDLESRLEKKDEQDRRLLKMVQRIISIQAFLSAIPEMDLVLTDAGFAVTENEQMAPASQQRVQALMQSLASKLDDSKDRLVLFLLRSSDYESWRGTEEFGRLSDGLIMTFSEFKDVAVLNNITAAAYPKGWSEFLKLSNALNIALMTDVASYISKDYAEEILERTRDKEPFSHAEQAVLQHVKTAIAALAMGDRKTGMDQVMEAVTDMKKDPDSFPTYTASAEAMDLSLSHDDTPVFTMF